VEDVILGCVNQAGEDNRNVARMALLLAGLPVEVPGTTVSRLCASWLEAVAAATRAIRAGEADVCVAGGVESMKRAPWVMGKPDRAFPASAPPVYDTSLGWRFVNPRMEELGHTDSIGLTAENLAAERYQLGAADLGADALGLRYDVSRARQDEFAVASHRKAIEAADAGRFGTEIEPVQVRTREGVTIVDRDESPHADTTHEKLAKLDPAFKPGGSVTAGNSSQLNDGATARAVVSSEYAQSRGLPILARIRSRAGAGVPPRVMGIGPVPATSKALVRAGLSLRDMNLIELNEAPLKRWRFWTHGIWTRPTNPSRRLTP